MPEPAPVTRAIFGASEAATSQASHGRIRPACSDSSHVRGSVPAAAWADPYSAADLRSESGRAQLRLGLGDRVTIGLDVVSRHRVAQEGRADRRPDGDHGRDQEGQLRCRRSAPLSGLPGRHQVADRAAMIITSTAVPAAPATCCRVVMIALPCEYRCGGSGLSPLVNAGVNRNARLVITPTCMISSSQIGVVAFTVLKPSSASTRTTPPEAASTGGPNAVQQADRRSGRAHPSPRHRAGPAGRSAARSGRGRSAGRSAAG